MKVRSIVGVLLISMCMAGCHSGRIACPDVSGKKSGGLFSFLKKKPAPEDQAKEGTDIGGRDMEFGKDGLLKKKNAKMPTNKKKQRIVTKQGVTRK
ncbi:MULTISPECIES: hypothetical protein [Rufibacter]|uniref:Uncharacterized protein n=1 Tax=Rufibacter quisquiliarum TaxID=1549639 RepID=A0A839GG82_9BACT|nr:MULTISPECIES: hypothetical protein [Rufibacter]MBA9077570.1 hypothetical protein [Rufibacter quisquiliarum]